jgi:hypothetical protein
MIRSLASASTAPPKASRQKKDALFELAARAAAAAEQARAGGIAAVAKAAKAESRRYLRTGLELVASGIDIEGIDRSFAAAEATAKASTAAGDGGPELELRMCLVAVKGIASGEHPYVLMRRMTARLGSEYFDKAGSWILERLRKRRVRGESLIVPGDMPDIVRALALDRASLERAIRTAGRDVAAAALAGCPQESIDLAKPLFGKIGGAVLEDDAAYLRSRLSGDEIAQAQGAFLDVVKSLEEGGDLVLGEADSVDEDPAFVAGLTKSILDLDAATIRAALRSADGLLLAAAMQGMEPAAHNRILQTLPNKDARRILDAIDEADPLPRGAVRSAGRQVASLLLAAAKAKKTPKPALESLAAIRDWPD